MPKHGWLAVVIATFLLLAASLFALFFLLAGPLHAQRPTPARVFPGESWERIDKPESVGFSTTRLEALRG